MTPAIRVNDIGKKYRIGVGPKAGYRTLRESVVDAATGAWTRLRERANPAAAADGSSGAPGDFWALRDVSFEVHPGEVIGVIGRNGSGKSTLLKILSRITEPTRGKAELRGRVGSLLEVGTGFHPELTGRDNIYLNGAILGMARREVARKFDDIVAFSEIEQFLDTPVKRYSSGMYVRLAFAVAAHLDTEILLVDEVLAVGDAAFQRKCMSKMGEVSRTGRTVLFVSHNMAAVQNLCERTIVLNQGKMVFAGDCEEGVRRYIVSSTGTEGGDVDLSRHPNRRQGYSPFFQRLRFLNAKHQATNEVFCSDPLTIELGVDSGDASSVTNVFIEIYDSLGSRISTLSTHFAVCGPLHVAGKCNVVCRVDEVALAPGRYYLSLKARQRHRKAHDVIDQAAWFDVIPADFYRNGQLPQVAHGCFLIRSNWEAN